MGREREKRERAHTRPLYRKKVGGEKRRGMVRTAELVGDKLVGRLDSPHVLHIAIQREQVLLIFAKKYGGREIRMAQSEI